MVQAQLINKLLSSGDSSIITLNNLTDEFFSDYKDEFNYIKNHLQQYGKIPDKLTFIGVFPNFDVFDVKETNDYLLDALYEDRNKRYLTKTFNKIREALIAGNTENALQIYKDSGDKLLTVKHLEAIDILKDTSRYDRYVDKINKPKDYYVTTGFPELDQIIGGWDRKEEYATIIARSGKGKSFILFKMALAAAEQGLNVGLYEGEMQSDKVGYRMDALATHISNNKIIHGNADIQPEYKKALDSLKNIKGSIKVLTPAMVGGRVGVSTLRAFIEKYNLDMLCVDQHSLLEDDRKARNAVDRAANISTDIKMLQVLTQIPIITVSQQNREAVKDEKLRGTETISQSDKIGQDSTIVLSLEKKDDVLTINIVKARDGGDGKHLRYISNYDRGEFLFLPDENDASTASGNNKCEELKNEYEYDDSPVTDDKPF